MALSFINTSGSIISEDFCNQILIESKAQYVKGRSFGEDIKKIDEDIATTFDLLRERWEEIRTKLLNNEFDNTQLRDKWIKPFLSLLGFEPVFNPHNLISDAGIEFHIPYKGCDSSEAPLIHMVHTTTDFDTRDSTNRTHKNKSPHDLLQQFLNTTPHRWAILINGKKIRILHDFFHSITKGFIEFDLEGIFESSNTEQFRILYRIAHSSRFINQFEKKNDDVIKETCWLEKFHTLSVETGVKVGDNLRKQVHIAIETIGNGFAQNLNPDDFNEEKVKKFYSETLNIIYRLLFLLFAEQKGWLPVKNSVYARTYSINYLRERAEKADYLYDENEDLWEGLKVTFRLVTKGYTFKSGEEINAFGGQLFSDDRIYHIKSPLKNKHLLKAIDSLCFFSDKNLKNKINYATLAIDELGSVYESLLDYEPRILKENTEINNKQYLRGEFVLDNRSTERKTSGSYYTDSRLVAQLIDSALVPVIEKTITSRASLEDKRKALLNLKVADIACGSGAFLTAALEKMGEYLALIGKEEGEKPTDKELRLAKREILQNCIYGVDLNPMALELAKFSLWITASMPDLPLSFLDHKLKCGNSLIGATPELIKAGIPVEAFNPVTLDDKPVCNDLKKRVRKELEGLSKIGGGIQTGFDFRTGATIETENDTKQFEHILHSYQENAEEVENIAHEYEEVYNTMRENIDWKLADTWAAAFFILKDDINKIYPTNITLQKIKQGEPIDEILEMNILVLAKKYNFFHWHLEFPEVFEKGGFDCILGNPPWETWEFKTLEYFSGKDPEISTTKNTKIRNLLISELENSNINLFNDYQSELYFYYSSKKYFQFSNSYKLSNRGKINLYSKFFEKAILLSNTKKGVGLIVDGGIATGFDTSVLFQYLIDQKILKSVFHFVNKNKIFDIHRDTKFALVTLASSSQNFYFRFNLVDINQISDFTKHLSLTSESLKILNPNTKNCPILNNNTDLNLLLKLYENGNVINHHNQNNLWNIRNHRMINASDESNNIEIISELKNNGFIIKDHEVIKDGKIFLPIYESKLVWQYDHRFASYEGVSDEQLKKSNPTYLRIDEKMDYNKKIIAKDYISEEYANKKWLKKYNSWHLIYRNTTGSSNVRTSVCCFIPKLPVVLTAYILQFEESHSIVEALCFASNINSFIFDFAARRKVGGSHLSVYVFDQLPAIPPDYYNKIIGEFISNRVFQLSFTCIDLKGLAIDYGYDGEPFTWDENLRFQLKCELDAIYGHLYSLTREEFDYLLETFPIVKRRDIEKYNTYRTKETILKLFDEMEWVKEEMNKIN